MPDSVGADPLEEFSLLGTFRVDAEGWVQLDLALLKDQGEHPVTSGLDLWR